MQSVFALRMLRRPERICQKNVVDLHLLFISTFSRSGLIVTSSLHCQHLSLLDRGLALVRPLFFQNEVLHKLQHVYELIEFILIRRLQI